MLRAYKKVEIVSCMEIMFNVPLETIKCVKNLTTKDFMKISFMIKEDK